MGVDEPATENTPAMGGTDEPPAGSSDAIQQRLWQETYDARQKYFEDTVGPFPDAIMKMADTLGVWPGGGLFVIPAPRLGSHLAVYTSFGLTNPDMPTAVRVDDFTSDTDGVRMTRAEGTLTRKDPAPRPPGAAGYGYELLVIAEADQQWPLHLLGWAVRAELENDVDLLGRVERHDGLTVEDIDIDVDHDSPVNILIARAAVPLPVGTELPAGRMELLVATTITDEEMRWSQANGRGALRDRLLNASVGQVSRLGRPSVVR